MSNGQIGFNIPKELLDPILRDTVSAAIIKELGDPAEIIRKLVGKALQERVNSSGKRGHNDYENRFTFLEWMSGHYIRELAKEVLKDLFEQNREEVKTAIKISLEKAGNLGDIICNGFYESLSTEWHSKISVTLDSKEHGE